MDNTGAAGAASIEYRLGSFLFASSIAADLITIADIGRVCFIADDDRVARTDATATRSRAWIVDAVDAAGVWVRMDEALARAA